MTLDIEGMIELALLLGPVIIAPLVARVVRGAETDIFAQQS